MLALAAAVVVGLIASPGRSDPKPVAVTLHDPPAAPRIPAGFIGLSLEYEAVPAYAGTNPEALNPVFEQLVRNLTPGQAPVLRIGGDSTDRTWWPVPGMARPGGVTYSLTPRWASVTAALARELHARLVLGINLKADSTTLARHEADQLAQRIGARRIEALELGNEPELYGMFPWYRVGARAVKARARSYSPAAFGRDYARMANVVRRLPLAGPASGQPVWSAYTPNLISAQPRLRLVTLHRYATRGCFTTPTSPQYHTIQNLLTPFATQGLAATVSPYAHLPVPLRIDELGSVNCGGTRGVSDTFASSLWALDTLFQLAKIGVSGVNFHTFAGARYQPFTFQHPAGAWRASVKPVYYGMLMFARAAPPGSQLLAGSGHVAPALDVFSTRGTDGVIRTVLVNYGSQKREVTLGLPAQGTATVQRLEAPTLRAKTGVTIGGQSFGAQTGTGRLTGARHESTAGSEDGTYRVTVPAASAALLTARSTL